MTEKVFRSHTITPEEVLAADSTEFSIILTIGEDYTSDDSRIVYDFSSTLGTSCPSFYVNEASGYLGVYVSNPDVEYNARVWDLDFKHFVDSRHKESREAARMVVLDLSAGLKAGDTVELRWGETTGGFGPGAKVSSVVPRPDYKARIDVRYFDSQEKGMPDHGRDYFGYTRPVPDHAVRLEYKILPREPKRLRLIRKHDKALLVPYDLFWNISQTNDVSELVEADAQCEKNQQGAYEFKDKNVTVFPKNIPLTESAAMDNVYDGMNIYWGDLHTHSQYSIDCAQRSGMDMTPGMLMDFARFRAGLDFFAVTDHHQPWDEKIRHLGKNFWDETLKDVRAKTVDNQFIVFPGIEFRAARGDTAVVFNGFPSYEEIDAAGITDIRKVWEMISSCDLITIPHFHNPGNLPEGEWYYPADPKFEPVLEIYSDHGSYEREKVIENGRAWCKRFRWDRCSDFFVKNNYKYGFAANSDDHKGHVGVNGITAVYAEELSREALFEAYRKRNVYASTNARIRLLFTANEQLMGSSIAGGGSKEFFIDVIGENKLKKVELFRNGELHKRFVPENIRFTKEYVVDDNLPGVWYVRATQLDNHIAWSSPIWFE